MTEEKKKEFGRYYEQYYQQAVHYTMKKVGNPQASEDLTMETFTSCYIKFDDFDSNKANFATWFYFCLDNRIKNYYRDTRTTQDIDETVVSSAGFENEVLKAEYISELRNYLADALESLSENEREIIILSYFKKQNSKEIAARVGMTSENVRVISHRALKKIRKYFESRNIKWELED